MRPGRVTARPRRARYYLDTIKQLEQGSQHYIQMRKDLAELYVKLGRMNDAVFPSPQSTT